MLRLRRGGAPARRRPDEGRRRKGGQDAQGTPARQGRNLLICPYVAAHSTMVLRGFKLVRCLVREIREFLKRSKLGLQNSFFLLRAFMTLLYFVRIELFACAEGLGDTY